MSAKLINIVLDLETLSTQEDAAIIQIGCCIPEFDRVHVPKGISHEIEIGIAYEEALKSEFHKCGDTMLWWEQQDPVVRRQVFSGQDTYEDAFHQFKYWIECLRVDGADVAIWGNGSDFDNRLLSYSLDSMGLHKVWNFRNNRDLRTLKALFPVEITNVPINETKHTALGDARYEARLIDTIYTVYHSAGIL